MAEQMPNFPPPIRDVPPPTAQSEVERAIATHKSYVAPAAMVLFLYTLGYIPGLAFNIIFLSEAREVKRLSGRTPFGIELLYGLLIFGLLWFAGVLGIAMIVFGVGKSTMFALANWDPPRPTNARVVLVPTKKRPVVIPLTAIATPTPRPTASPRPKPTQRATVTPPQPEYRGKSFLTSSKIPVYNKAPDEVGRTFLQLESPVGIYVMRETTGGTYKRVWLECLVSRWEGDSWVGWVQVLDLESAGAVEMSRKDMTKQLPLLKAE